MAFGWRTHQSPVNSPHKGPVTRKMFPFDDVIMEGVTFQVKKSRYETIITTKHCRNKTSYVIIMHRVDWVVRNKGACYGDTFSVAALLAIS